MSDGANVGKLSCSDEDCPKCLRECVLHYQELQHGGKVTISIRNWGKCYHVAESSFLHKYIVQKSFSAYLAYRKMVTRSVGAQ